MNRSELINSVAESVGLSKTKVEAVIKEFIGTVHQELSSGSKIDLYGLGTFKVKDTAARNRRNPQNGNIIPVPAGKKVSFKAAPALKAAILH